MHEQIASIETEILAAVNAMPARHKARLMPELRRRLEDYYDLQAVKRAQAKGVYHAYQGVRPDGPNSGQPEGRAQ